MIPRSPTSAPLLDPRIARGIRARLMLLALAFVPAFGSLLYRALVLQIFERSRLTGLAKDQYLRQAVLPGRRGAIYDRRGTSLAASVEVDSIFVDPSQLASPPRAAERLGEALKLDPQKLAAAFSQARHFTWLKRQATPEEVAKVQGLALPGVAFVREPKRFYPQRELAAHVLGFSGIDGEGLEGVELALDAVLKGKPRAMVGLRDARGRPAIVESAVSAEELEGASVHLTLDRAVQYVAEKALASAVLSSHAQSGSSVVLDPATGEILALANFPTFNPNAPQGLKAQAVRNRAVADAFEPGSTCKMLTLAAALEEGQVRPRDVFFCENGRWALGRRVIHDHGGHGWLDLPRIVQVSSNIGVAKVAQKVGTERLHAYHAAFGLGQRPGSGLPGETRGSIPNPKAEISLATQSFGQGLTVSAVQLAAAYGAIANGGALMRPFIVSRVVSPEGQLLLNAQPEQIRRVISPKTASELLSMMRLVVEREGTAPLARMDDWWVAGKTGTAQKADPLTGGYSVDKRVASFVGIVPADAPKLVILVVIDEPKNEIYGGLIAAPAFKEIAQGALAHLGVPRSPGLAAARPSARAPGEAKPAGAAASARLKGAFAMAAVQPALVHAEAEGFIDEAASDPAAETVVPDVQGLSARAAVRALSAAYLEPSLLGSGRAIGQTPPAGTTVRKGARVALRLEPTM